jgi:hypothetical protein
MTSSRVEIYVQLLNEGTPTARPTDAMKRSDGTYEILRPEDYDPADEEWEFSPGSIVRCELVKWHAPTPVLLAVEKLNVK